MSLRPGPRDALDDVPGIRLGHATVPGGGSGCTVLLGPFRARVEAAGLAGGSREFTTLQPAHVTGMADALVLTGGSAWGLSTADGVMAWLEERGEGFGVSQGVVPIVPAAVLYDLADGVGRPGPAEGRAACEDAAGSEASVARGEERTGGWGSRPGADRRDPGHDPGRDPGRDPGVGAGAGARVGRLLGAERAMPGGLGSASLRLGPWMVGALAVVNALGAVTDGRGGILAGARPDPDGPPSDPLPLLLEEVDRGDTASADLHPGEQTTLAVVATDAPLTEADLVRFLRVAATALPRRIDPVFTPFDGDVVFGLVPGSRGQVETGSPLPLDRVLALGVAARNALECSIERAVTTPTHLRD